MNNIENFTVSELARNLGTYNNRIKEILKKNDHDWSDLKRQLKLNQRAYVENLLVDEHDPKMTNDELYAYVRTACGRSLFQEILHLCFEKSLIDRLSCKFCQCEHTRLYGNGIFCSQRCARSYAQTFVTDDGKRRQLEALKQRHAAGDPSVKSTKRSYRRSYRRSPKPVSRLTRLKISEGVKRHYANNPEARQRLSVIARQQKVSEETRAKLSERAKERVLNGTHKGWTSRNITSYPEKVWMKVLTDNDIPFEREVSLNKRKHLGLNNSSNYLLDFFIIGQNRLIDIEIDGKQHKYPERQQSDVTRDIILKDNGITVIRLPWVNPAHNKKEFNRQKSWVLNFLSKELSESGLLTLQ